MLPTKQNVSKAINVRFKGATLKSCELNRDTTWTVVFQAPKDREWSGKMKEYWFRTDPNILKKDAWAACFEFIDKMPALEHADFAIPDGSAETPSETLLEFMHPDFRFPTGKELENVIRSMGLSFEKFCAMFDIESRTLRRWRADETHVSYVLWRLVLIYSGKVEI